jgi:hypothetical protein
MIVNLSFRQKLLLSSLAIILIYALAVFLFNHGESSSKTLMIAECQQNKLFRSLASKFRNESLFTDEQSFARAIEELNPTIEKLCHKGYLLDNGSFHIATGERLELLFRENFFAICISKMDLRIYKKETLNTRYLLFTKEGQESKRECEFAL